MDTAVTPRTESAASAAQAAQPERLALRGDLLDFTADPGFGALGTEDDLPSGVRFRPDHWLLMENGRILRAQREDPGPGWRRVDQRGRLVLPGFIDTHVHSPQVEVIASYGKQLLDWLENYTFPAESRYVDQVVAHTGAELFCDALLAEGTTSASVFPTVHKISVEELFAAASARGMRMITGKCLMNRNAPKALCDDVAGAERDCVDLIERWHGVGRNAYSVTVRFAPTSTPEQLAMAGALCAADSTLYMQTHVAENQAEVRWVAELFPEARSYLDVYARAGLLHERSVLAHGIWLDDEDRACLADAGGQIASCPSSNLFLGSGLFDWSAASAAGVPVSLASDVGGGTSLSMLRTMNDAYKVQAMRGVRTLTAWKLLHAATLAPAEALGLAEEIGSLEDGRMADVTVWDWARGRVAERRLSVADSLHEKLFAWLLLADDRNLVLTYVAGIARHVRR